ncbi:sigma-54-dependent transcriptional regulator [Chitinophagaceae bacterium MMS25-I14]
MTEQILIVEDELIVARDIRRTLERAGHKVAGVAQTVEKAMQMVQEHSPWIVLVDIYLKGNETGIDLALKLNGLGIPFIYISANSSQPILEAVKQTNPYGFIVKPFRERDLLVTLDIAGYRFENNQQMQREKETGQATLLAADLARNRFASTCEGLIGNSPAMQQVFELVEQVAQFDTSVLLQGESGTGKEVIAGCIFSMSARSNKPFVRINCAAIPDGLMEAELFGYEKGSFTGANERKPGKFEMASGGTILLDEIGEVPLDMQAKLLRVLQDKEVYRIGSSTAIKTDVRILAATNQNLEKLVGEGKFRLDLYYRLHVFPISLPPLRDRREDIPLLVQYYIRHYNRQLDKNVAGLSAADMEPLIQYDWPGNVRELQHLVERSVLMSRGETLHIVLPEKVQQSTVSTVPKENLRTLEEIERAHILSVLQQCNFRITGKNGAAELLALSPSVLQRKIKQLGIQRTYISDEGKI